jgi:hypothetical protein
MELEMDGILAYLWATLYEFSSMYNFVQDFMKPSLWCLALGSVHRWPEEAS